jgi:hypothetical protein
MLRMAHITFFGFGVLNLAFGLTCRVLELRPVPALPSVLLIVGAVTMPTVCYLSAWRPEFRRMFVVPAAAVIIAAIAFLVRLFR